MSHVEVTNGGGLIITGARKRWVIAIAASCSLALGAWSNGLVDAKSVAAVLKDPLSLFAARSPGARAPGALTQTKPARSLGLLRRRGAPQERALASGRRSSATPTDSVDTEAPEMTVAPVEPVDDGVSIVRSLGSGREVFAGGGGGGGAPFFLAPTSNGPGIGAVAGEPGTGTISAPGTGGGPLPTPISPVPEPETWLMMMIGLFAVGTALRRKNIAATKTGACVADASIDDPISTAHS